MHLYDVKKLLTSLVYFLERKTVGKYVSAINVARY